MKKTPERRNYDHELTLHHKKPRSIGGSRHETRNHSWVPRIQHNAWHTIFQNETAQEICHKINKMFLDPDYRFVCIKKQSHS
jgi:hypothetical protein